MKSSSNRNSIEGLVVHSICFVSTNMRRMTIPIMPINHRQIDDLEVKSYSFLPHYSSIELILKSLSSWHHSRHISRIHSSNYLFRSRSFVYLIRRQLSSRPYNLRISKLHYFSSSPPPECISRWIKTNCTSSQFRRFKPNIDTWVLLT